MRKIKGKLIFLGDNIDTDQILPGYAMAEPYEKLGEFAMAGLAELDFKSVYEPGSIIVAGKNFGCGSSREQAPIALKQCGVSLILAKGFARIFRRNAVNIGLPVWKIEDTDFLTEAAEAEVDIERGEITIKGKTRKFAPMAENTLKTLEYGGLISRVRAELGIE